MQPILYTSPLIQPLSVQYSFGLFFFVQYYTKHYQTPIGAQKQTHTSLIYSSTEERDYLKKERKREKDRMKLKKKGWGLTWWKSFALNGAECPGLGAGVTAAGTRLLERGGFGGRRKESVRSPVLRARLGTLFRTCVWRRDVWVTHSDVATRWIKR